MPVDIRVPPLSQTLDTLVLVEWLKQVGDWVKKGEALYTVETDKATLEVESPADGTLASIMAQPGDEIAIRGVIGSILEVGEAHAITDKQRIFVSPRARQLAFSKGLTLEELKGLGTGPQQMIIERDVQGYLDRVKPRVTPVAQRMAEEAGLELASITPARPGEPIRKADVEASLQQRGLPGKIDEAPDRDKVADKNFHSQKIPLSAIRKTIAKRMSDSHWASAAVTYMSEVDATRLVKLRTRILKEVRDLGLRPTYTDLFIRLTALVLQKHPQLNATFDGSVLEYHPSLHIALAVDTERGLVVPVIPYVEQMGLLAITKSRSELMQRAIKGELKPDEMSNGTFTITNLGSMGIDHFTPIINPPQVAILGFGRIREVPAMHKGKLRSRFILGLSVTCDHRVIDGAPAARFLQDICKLVECPELIWL